MITLAVIASLLIILFQASVTRLIPLYAIGVFLSFTLSQAGMAVRWNKIGKLKLGEEIHEIGSTLRHDPKWRGKMLINSFGALCTAVVMIIFAVTKFTEGAWVILLLIPILVTIFFRIHHHYKSLARSLTLENYVQSDGQKVKQKVLILISTVHRGTLAAVRYARSLSDDITAVHVGLNPEDYQKVEDKWKIWGEGLPLVILESPYRQLYTPILSYIKELETQKSPNEIITVVIPEFITRRWWEKWLHWHTADLLRRLFVEQSGVVIVEVPYQV